LNSPGDEHIASIGWGKNRLHNSEFPVKKFLLLLALERSWINFYRVFSLATKARLVLIGYKALW
jgi:hypothetical protein